MKYEIKTLKDIFDMLPADRIKPCLHELAIAMEQAKAMRTSTPAERFWPTPRCAASGMSMWKSCARPLERGLWDDKRTTRSPAAG